MAHDALSAPEVRAADARLVQQGWVDALRKLHPDEVIYTFFDYFRNTYARSAGFSIDHLLCDKPVTKRPVAAQVDNSVRGWDKASDHCLAWIELS